MNHEKRYDGLIDPHEVGLGSRRAVTAAVIVAGCLILATLTLVAEAMRTWWTR